MNDDLRERIYEAGRRQLASHRGLGLSLPDLWAAAGPELTHLQARAERAEIAAVGAGRVANGRGAALEWVRLALRRWDEQPRRDWDHVNELVDGLRAALNRPGINQPAADFFEEDEPPEKVLEAFRKGAKGRTAESTLTISPDESQYRALDERIRALDQPGEGSQ